jgi:hypothetical protein
MPKRKEEDRYYTIVAAANKRRKFGAFPRTDEGKENAETYRKKFQSSSNTVLVII